MKEKQVSVKMKGFVRVEKSECLSVDVQGEGLVCEGERGIFEGVCEDK